MILCLVSVIGKVCLNGLLKSLFCSIVRVGTRKSWIFPHFVEVDLCAVASLLVERYYFGCKIYFSFHVGMLMMFDSARNLLKNQFQGLIFAILCNLEFLKGVGLSKFFLLVTAFR